MPKTVNQGSYPAKIRDINFGVKKLPLSPFLKRYTVDYCFFRLCQILEVPRPAFPVSRRSNLNGIRFPLHSLRKQTMALYPHDLLAATKEVVLAILGPCHIAISSVDIQGVVPPF